MTVLDIYIFTNQHQYRKQNEPSSKLKKKKKKITLDQRPLQRSALACFDSSNQTPSKLLKKIQQSINLSLSIHLYLCVSSTKLLYCLLLRKSMDPQSAAEKAVSVIGFGYDLTNDLRLTSCKAGPSQSRLLELDETVTRDLVFPGGVVVKSVSSSIKCDKGERTRFSSDVLSFNHVNFRSPFASIFIYFF